MKKIDSLAELVKVYRKHQPGITALDKRITATDRLIDQIVYRLYGLTDEEIAVVETGTDPDGVAASAEPAGAGNPSLWPEQALSSTDIGLGYGQIMTPVVQRPAERRFAALYPAVA